MAGGAWDAKEKVWRGANSRFLFGKDALAACFKARFIRRLESLRRRGRLRFAGEASALSEPAAWDALVRRLRDTKWIVYPKATSGRPEQTLDCLGRYTHRVAVSDHRILAVRDGRVTFAWRDRADGNALGKTAFREASRTCGMKRGQPPRGRNRLSKARPHGVRPGRKPRSNPIARGRPPRSAARRSRRRMRLRSTHFIPYAAK